MKTVLAVAAILGLSASAALADCAWHNKTSAKIKVDKTITTASVVTTEKQSRLPADTEMILTDEQKSEAVTK